jgi:hypothetical protein
MSAASISLHAQLGSRYQRGDPAIEAIWWV